LSNLYSLINGVNIW